MPANAKKKILLVEDEAILAMVTQKQLKKYNYDIEVVYHGEEAVEYTRQHDDIDLILMDINLGSGINGPEAAKQILTDIDIPVVFHSSHTEPEVVEQTEQITSYGYVVKNSGITVLDASIKMAFKLHEANTTLEKHKNMLQSANTELTETNAHLEEVNRELWQSRRFIEISETRFKNLFNNMRNAVAVYDSVENGQNFIIRDFNYAAEKTDSIEREKVLGRKVTDVFPGVIEYGLFDVFKRVWQSGEPEVHPVSEYKDNRIQGWRENYVFKLPSGEIVAVYDDLSEQKRLEFTLNQTQSILTTMFENSHAGIALADPPDGRLRYVNRAGLLILGGAEEELAADIDINAYMASWNIHYLDGTSYKHEDVPLSRAVQKGETVSEEFIIRRENCEDRYVLANAGPVKDSDGSILAGMMIFQDISDQKMIQKELEQSRRDLQASQRIARLGSWRMDVATNKVIWTEELYRMYGFDPGTDPPDYDKQMAIFTPLSWERLSTALDQTVKTGEPYELELEMAKDGQPIGWMWVRGEAVKDEKGRTVELWGAAQDITDRRRLQDSLRKNEELLNRTGEMARVGGWEVDLKSETVYWTSATKLIHEVSMDYEPTLKNALTFFPGKSREILLQAFNKAIEEGEDYDLELDFLTAKGNQLKVRTIGHAEYSHGTCTRIYGIFQDRTLHTKYLSQKSRDETQYKILADLHGMFGSHRDDLLDFIIEASNRITGSEFSFFGLMSEDEKEMTVHAWSKSTMKICAVSDTPMHFLIDESGIWGDCVRQRKTVIYNDYGQNIPAKHGTPDGHVPITRFMAVPVFEKDRIVAVGAVANKKDPYEVYDANAVGTIYDRLWDSLMRKKAEVSLIQSEQRNKTLLREVNHRIKNSFYIIQNMLQLNIDRIGNKTAVRVMNDLNSRILTMSELYSLLDETGPSEYIQMDAYCNRIAQSLKSAYTSDAKNVTFSIDIEPLELPVKDASTLGMIVNEILMNSLKYAFPDNRSGTVSISFKRDAEQLVLNIADNGIGLLEEHSSVNGNGYGLQIIEAMTEQLYGEVTIDGRGGTSFEIKIPLHH